MMKTSCVRPLFSLSTAFAVILLFAGAAQAEIPNLVGTWSGEYDAATPTGVVKSSSILVIRKQEGPLLYASRTWKRTDDSLGHHRGQATKSATEELIGVIDYDNKSILFVKNGPGPDSTGIFRGQIAGNTLKLIFIQSGEFARASRFTLTREEK